MKKLSRIGAHLLAALAIVACQPVDEPTPPTPDIPDEPAKTRTIEVELQPVVKTRAAIDDGAAFSWNDGDANQFAALADGKIYAPKAFSLESGKPVFTIEVPEETASLAAFYRASTLTPTAVNINIAAAPTQREAGLLENFTLVGKESVAIEAEATAVVATSELVTSVVRFGIYSSEEAYVGETIRSVVVAASQPINGTYKFDLARKSGTLEGGTNTIELGLATTYAIGAEKDSAKGLYAQIAPATSAGVTYTVKTDVAKYTFVMEGDVNFEAGTIHNIYFDLKNATSRLENNAQIVTYDTTYLTTALQMSAMGGQQDLGYYLAAVDGVQDTTNYEADYYSAISFDIKSDNGEAVDWVSCSIANYNHPIVNVARNTSEQGRTCTIDIIYTPSTKDYAIENPVVATIAVAQNGASAVSTLSYQWFGDAEIIIPGGGLNGAKGLGYFLAYLDGSATAVPDAEAIEPFFKTVEVTSNADWCRVSVVGGNFNNLQLEAVGANPSTTEERVATITATFKGDTETYKMEPDNTAFILRVVQQPAKAAGETSELYYTTANLSTSTVISAAGVVERDLGYFFAMVDGMQTDDGTSKYFASLEISVDVPWITARIGGNHFYITVDASQADSWRKGVVTISYPESDTEVALRGGNPAVTIEVTQMPTATEGNVAIYTFGNDPNNLSVRRDVEAASNGVQNLGVTWMSVYKIISGVVDSTRDNTFGDEAHAMTYSYVDGEGRPISWLSAGVGGDWLNYSAEANNTGALRVGYIHVHPATAPGQAYEGYDIPDPCLVVKVTQAAN